jgi:hypothetical protein
MIHPPDRDDRIDMRMEESPRTGMAAILVLIALITLAIVVLSLGEPAADTGVPTEPTTELSTPLPEEPIPTTIAP